jgi:acyl-coenzyme A thioesterase PaaI-like protein
VTLAELIRSAKQTRDLNRFVGAIPYARYLGISAVLDGDQIEARLAQGPHIIGNPALPAIHGGVVGAFLETTAILQLLWTLERIRVPKTITITIDYLRSAGAVDTLARAEVTKLGARIANVRAIAWQGDPDTPVAAANANFLISPAKENDQEHGDTERT